MTPPVQDAERGTQNTQLGGSGETEFAPAPPLASLLTPNSQRPIELHIEELILRGFAPNDRYRIGEAVESELRRLLAVADLPEWFGTPGHRAELPGGQFVVPLGTECERIGAQVARAVYEGGSP